MAQRTLACLLLGSALLLGFLLPGGTPAQEIPLDHCDALPVMEVGVDGQPMRFLVDTAASLC